MAITIRLTDEQEIQLQTAMELTGQATKSKAVLYMIENSKELIGSTMAFKQIKKLEYEIETRKELIARLKENY
jgi:hypothetical protein